MIWINLLGILLALLGGYLTYAYITFLPKEGKRIKTFFKVDLRKRELVFTLIILVTALVTGAYGRYRNEYTAVQCYLNIGVMFLLAAMAWVDYREKIIPNHLILAGMVLWLLEIGIEVFLLHTDIRVALAFSALGGGIWGGLLIVIALIAKTALGMGDAKMFLVIGLIYGLNNTYSILLISLLVMAIVSITLLAMKRVERKSTIPMAPFVLIGFTLCIFLGM
ncbi:MAG: prepilin peptidase [Lachnospiraceae bacterium]|nr:prepilin peptidase [Lachnospiraceae bacterium]